MWRFQDMPVHMHRKRGAVHRFQGYATIIPCDTITALDNPFARIARIGGPAEFVGSPASEAYSILSP